MTKAEQEYCHRCKEFSQAVIKPFYKQYDDNNSFPSLIHEKAREWDILHAGIPVEWGGKGFSPLALVLSGLPMAEVCAPTTFTMGFNHGTLRPVLKYGSNTQKQKFVRELIEQKKYASWCMTEPELSGSSLFEITTTARKAGDSWILNGKKCMIGNGCVSEQFMVLARTVDGDKSLGLSIFVVPKDSTVNVGPNIDKLGFRSVTTPTIEFTNTEIPLENVIGGEGQGIAILLDSLDYMRFGGGIVIAGLILGTFKELLPWLEGRNVFGGKLVGKSHVQIELGKLMAEYHALERLLIYCCGEIAADRSCSVETATLKLLGSELSLKVTDRAVQMMGWRGIDDDYPIQKRYRDARQTTIFEGTTEVVAANIFQSFRLAASELR